jgi:hypothetical protein
LKYVSGSEQVLFTTTDLNLFAPGFVEQAEVWKVESGKVERDVIARRAKPDEAIS